MCLSQTQLSIMANPNNSHPKHYKLLLNTFVKCYLEKEIHLIFDHPHTSLHPKCIEHKQRDKQIMISQHVYHRLTDVPNMWSELLQCRECKSYLYWRLHSLKCHQNSFKWSETVHGEGGVAQDMTTTNIEHTLQCNAEEADMRIWLHVNKSPGKRVLVYSPDTAANGKPPNKRCLYTNKARTT